MRERERERERQTETERETDRDRERDRDTEANRQADENKPIMYSYLHFFSFLKQSLNHKKSKLKSLKKSTTYNL